MWPGALLEHGNTIKEHQERGKKSILVSLSLCHTSRRYFWSVWWGECTILNDNQLLPSIKKPFVAMAISNQTAFDHKLFSCCVFEKKLFYFDVKKISVQFIALSHDKHKNSHWWQWGCYSDGGHGEEEGRDTRLFPMLHAQLPKQPLKGKRRKKNPKETPF